MGIPLLPMRSISGGIPLANKQATHRVIPNRKQERPETCCGNSRQRKPLARRRVLHTVLLVVQSHRPRQELEGLAQVRRHAFRQQLEYELRLVGLRTALLED